ncbi:AAA domain-containing protein [Actinomycetospora straminea]|uniref:AAA domain-containing protein n=1 Tax=Actinomycetospora straminea TaxID=663607 RepID=UPI002365DA0D|nr:AAA domain-containing protein [Actinomycetospora straminea]MDD7933920.1 AAA domain-containing protein [Actinomycetospora straminea]
MGVPQEPVGAAASPQDLPEHDPALRDRVQRFVGVLRRVALARARPVRHTRHHVGALPLVEVADQGAVRRPREAGDEILRAPAEGAMRATFDALFDLMRAAADQPEAVELVLAGGLLHAPDHDVRVHLLTRPVRIERDADANAMVVTLAGDATRWEDEELLVGTGLVDDAAPAEQDAPPSPLDPDLVGILAGWADRHLRVEHARGDDWIGPTGPGTALVPAPALLARRRGAAALRTFYDAMVADLAGPGADTGADTGADETRPLPVGLAQLVAAIEPADRAAWLARTGHDEPPVTDPLFPLPVGAAQGRILGRLGRDSGVVVEGPPGTGKTHTIANLLCALLAEGRRVLVTSEKAQALRVLRDKLPPEMRDLCVSLADADEDPGLGAGIAGLATRSTEFDPDEADRAVADLAERRDALRADREAALDALVAERTAETTIQRDLGPGMTGTRAEVVRRLRSARERDGWLAEVVDPETELPPSPPLSVAEFRTLRTLLATETPARRERARQVLPPPVELPPEDHVADLAATVLRGLDATSGDVGPLVAALGGLPPDAAAHLPGVSRRAADALAELDDTGDDAEWAHGVADAVLSGRAGHLWGRATDGLRAVDDLLEHDRRAGPAQVRVDDAVDVAAAAPVVERFAAFLADGGTTRRLFKPDEQKAVEPHLAGIRLQGADPATVSGASAIAHHLRILEITDRLAEGFGPLGRPLRRAEHRAMLVEQALTLRATCLAVGRVLTAAVAVRALLAALPPAERPRVDSLARLRVFATLTLDVDDHRAAELARGELDEVVERVEGGVPPERQAPELVAVLDALRRRDADAYTEAVAAVESAHAEARDQRRLDALADRLERAAPGVVALLRAHAAEPWPDREDRLEHAWAYARAAARTRRWAAAEDAPDRLADLDVELARTTGKLAAAQAWRACLGRITAEQMRALQSHRASVAAVGRGTGRHADRYREAAREAVEVARDAVPAWVMPIREVLAAVEPRPDAFDVVIVDEASQADLTSLFLLWLAPRVIVVGDDRQCTPADVGGGSLEPAFARLETDLPEVPFYLRSQFTPRASVFSVFRATFGPPIRLREHFRSMPEIVGWSSREFYAGPGEADAPLVPLRQFGADRLPPLRATFVPDAAVRGQGSSLANDAEAAALVDAVARCAADPAYAGATFGVVVLQGHGQVELIEGLLRERLDVETWERRRLRVGVAADFQGDERDVVWLSMVVAPGHRLVALTAERYRQAFNVAASRARDQMWLFHSVHAEDLAETDLRRKLLEHVTARSPDGSAGAPENRPAPAEVDRERRHPAFGSLFAQRVFADLSDLGFAVVPQVEVHGRVLDLVVTGASGRLAVLCDGDETRRPATRADVEAEHDLRRCGWPVVRIAESRYLGDPEGAITPVLEAAAAADITPSAPTGPLAVVESAPADHTEYRPRRGRSGRAVIGAETSEVPETLDDLVDDLAAQGFPPPRRDARVHDPRGGGVLTDAAALWPTGISRRALAPPVLLAPDVRDLARERLRDLGYRVFTTVADLRAHLAASAERS